MALAVCLLFDPRSDRLIRELWARLERKEVRTLASHTHGQHLPHLSYAVLLDGDVDRVRAACESLPSGGPFEVRCQGMVTFPRGRAALMPAVSAGVMVRQEQVAAAVRATGAVLHKHYEPGHWVPHVSLATRAAGGSLSVVAQEVAAILPLVATAERAALVDSTTGDVWPLDGVP